MGADFARPRAVGERLWQVKWNAGPTRALASYGSLRERLALPATSPSA
jgi:hypothetical protein